jgi:DNA-directed RNA polymerase specialized sigma24 family protein
MISTARAEIFAYIQSKVGDSATADDLTQETFVKVSRALAKCSASQQQPSRVACFESEAITEIQEY